MNKPRLLYISINDGSDTRINKEVKSLATRFEVHYLGIGKNNTQSFAEKHCSTFLLATGHHKSPLVLLKYYCLFLRKYLFGSYHSIHIINENLLLIFLPFLIWQRRKIVLDVFDSIFLRSGSQWQWLQAISYRIPKVLIVTDSNRKSLIPAPFESKTVVVENYPYYFQSDTEKNKPADQLTIFYNGSMSKVRGTLLLLAMLKTQPQLRIKMAGWVYDEPTQLLAEHPQVDFLGTITQQESMQLAAQCDYILSLYEPVNANNINASPNKIYDAIQAGTPVIINREVKIASFVEQHRLGYVMESFYETNYETLFREWLGSRHNYVFDDQFKAGFTWEAIENKLLEAHEK